MYPRVTDRLPKSQATNRMTLGYLEPPYYELEDWLLWARYHPTLSGRGVFRRQRYRIYRMPIFDTRINAHQAL